MIRKIHLAAAAAPIALLASTSALAQSAQLVVAFQGANSAVPLGPWTSIAAALCIVGIALVIFRRQRAGRATHWAVWLAAVVGAAVSGLPFEPIRTANAIPIPTLSLTTSPASMLIGAFNADVNVQNATSGNVSITSVTVTAPLNGQFVQIPPTTCLVGTILAPGQTCFVHVNTSGG